MATKKQWSYALASRVGLIGSGEVGKVIGRAHYLESNPSYYVRYVDAQGILSKGWFDEADLTDLGLPKDPVKGNDTNGEE